MRRPGWTFLALLAACAGCAGAPASEEPVRPPPVVLEEGDLEKLLERQRILHQPGVHHHRLDSLVGDWRVHVERRSSVSQALAPLAVGRAAIRWKMGGRFLELEIELDVRGVPHAVSGLLGYDAAGEEYQALWISAASSAMSFAHGRGNPDGRGIVFEAAAPSGGAVAPLSRSVLRILDADRFTIERVGPDAFGQDGVLERTSYLRGLTR